MKSIKTFILFLPIVLTLDAIDMNFTIDYFKNRDAKFICLLTCEDNNEMCKNIYARKYIFTKTAINHSIRVSQVRIHDTSNFNKINKCLSQNVSIGVLTEANCSMYEDVMSYASQNTFFNAIRKWLIISKYSYTEYNNVSIPETNVSEIEALHHLDVSLDADIVLTTRESQYKYVLYDIFNFGKIQGGDLIVEKMCVWHYKKGLSKNINGYKYYRRWNFKELTMRMIIVSKFITAFKPEMLTDQIPALGIADITKTSSMVLNVIAEIHNVRFIYTIADIWIGEPNKNNTNKVVLNGLVFKTQDITPVIRYNENSVGKVDIVQPPVTYIETKYFYRIPTYGAGKYENQFLRPLSSGTWICIVATSVLSGVVLLVSARWERRTSFGEYAIFSVLASICQQFFEDHYESSRVSSARKLTILVTGLFCVIIYNYYTSSVVSWLLSAAPPTINSLEELLDSPLELIYEDIGYTRSWLQSPSYHYNIRNSQAEDRLRKYKVINKKKDAPLLKTLEEGIAMVKAGGYAYHTQPDSVNSIISRTFTQRELCELGSVQSMEKTDLYVALQKNSPYREFLTWSLMRLAERGIISCIRRRRDGPQVKCEGSSPRALALGGAAPAFVLLAAGYALAIIITLIERFMKRKKLLLKLASDDI